MNIRESMEERELELLSPYAAYSGRSRGRDREEEECDVRTCLLYTSSHRYDSQEFLFDNYVVYAIDGLDTVRIF